jgi:transcription elongation factor GreB
LASLLLNGEGGLAPSGTKTDIMSKAFTTETDAEPELEEPEPLPAHVPNYVTPNGLAVLQDELRMLVRDERPKIVEIVSWAAGNGDRSENGDYLYGKKRLREIDRRIRYLTKRLESAKPVDPRKQQGIGQVFFGATVAYAGADGVTRTVALVGVDEADVAQGKISWISPLAKALMKARTGDTVELRTAAGIETLEVLSVTYPAP